MVRRVVAVLVVLAVVGPLVLPVTADSAAAQTNTLHRTVTLSLTPERPGEIGVELQFDIPDGVTELSVRIADDATVTATDGFSRESATRYEWTRTTDQPSVTYRLPANETGAQRRGRPVQDAGYTFVDAGPWALVSTPSHAYSYAGVGQEPTTSKSVEVTGAGVPGTAITYLGPFDTYTRRAAGQDLTLVVPDDARMASPPDEILLSVADAANRLDIGARDDEVVMFAAPSTVRWNSPGLQVGPNELWVRDDEPAAEAGSIWIHEYVHTRQPGSGDRSGRWLTEATAEYYGTLVPLRVGLVNYTRFSDHLSIGTRPEYASVTLADPSTWDGTGANYWKGTLVAAAIDREIRLASGGERTLADAYRRVQETDNHSNEDFLAAVERVGGPAAREAAARYTETDASPSVWNETAQAIAFGSAIEIEVHVTDRTVSGPYRSGGIPSGGTLVPNETLAASIAVENVDTRHGRFALVVRVDGRPVGVRSGALGSGASASLDVDHRFTSTGDHVLAVGPTRIAVPVRAPATPTVRELRVPAQAPPGEPVPVTALVANEADRPVDGNLTITASEEVVGAEPVILAPGETREVVVPVTIDSAGEYTLVAGNATGAIRITEAATPPTSSSRGDGTAADGGGFGLLSGLVAGVVGLIARRL